MGCDCSKHWALIVAGSKGKRMVTTKENKTYEEDNYRHQVRRADIVMVFDKGKSQAYSWN